MDLVSATNMLNVPCFRTNLVDRSNHRVKHSTSGERDIYLTVLVSDSSELTMVEIYFGGNVAQSIRLKPVVPFVLIADVSDISCCFVLDGDAVGSLRKTV